MIWSYYIIALMLIVIGYLLYSNVIVVSSKNNHLSIHQPIKKNESVYATIYKSGGIQGFVRRLEISHDMSYRLFNHDEIAKKGILNQEQQNSLKYLISHLTDAPVVEDDTNGIIFDGMYYSIEVNNKTVLSFGSGRNSLKIPNDILNHNQILDQLVSQ